MIDTPQFVATQVAPYLSSAKTTLIRLAGLNYDPETNTYANNYTLHPHYVESYYLLSSLITQ